RERTLCTPFRAAEPGHADRGPGGRARDGDLRGTGRVAVRTFRGPPGHRADRRGALPGRSSGARIGPAGTRLPADRSGRVDAGAAARQLLHRSRLHPVRAQPDSRRDRRLLAAGPLPDRRRRHAAGGARLGGLRRSGVRARRSACRAGRRADRHGAAAAGPRGEPPGAAGRRPAEAVITGRETPEGQVHSVSPEQISPQLPELSGPMTTGAYGELAAEDPESPRPQALPEPDTSLGPHLSYAFQWWLFALFFPGALIYRTRKTMQEEI